MENDEKNLGLNPDDEVKWNLPTEKRKTLQNKDCPIQRVHEKSIEIIAGMKDLLCVVTVMVEKRNKELWKQLWPKTSIRDFYCEGLRYVIQRVAEHVEENNASSCVVVCDTPELGKKNYFFGAIKRGSKAVQKAYFDWYLKGVGEGPGRKYHQGPLSEIKFHPSILISDASFHDMLQIADMVVGLTTNWVFSIINNRKSDSELIGLMQYLSKKFRMAHGSDGFWGDGLVLWPKNEDIWERLKKSLR